ncbi:MAG: hypothetical protein HRT72_11160 [Flavobacteriales bacterium]|nr:hypothetical protein [Flavobacteriales bacterium]
MKYTPSFITTNFLLGIKSDGRLLEAMTNIKTLSNDELTQLPRLPKMGTWELVLEEVIDTDHDIEYYYRFINELHERNISDNTINEMRLVAWETAGWYNFEMMAWDWCSLNTDDMILGLNDRLKKENISQDQYQSLKQKIEKHKT